MNHAIRMAAGAVCLALLWAGCEREERVLAPEIRPLASTSALTSGVTDAAGDMAVSEQRSKVARQAYQDIVRVQITEDGGTFHFTMELAGDVPDTPELAPPGVVLLEWRWGVNTNPMSSPRGFPNSPGSPAPAEYMLQIMWDGTAFAGQLIDRTALPAGGEAILNPLTFTIDGAELTAQLAAERLGNPSSFLWVAATVDWPTPLGTGAHLPVDFAPSVDAGEPQATWPE